MLLLLGAVLGALFLYLAVRRLDWSAFAAEIGRAHFAQILLGVVCLFSYYGVKAERWKHLIAPFARASGRDLQPAVLAGLAGNYVFPHFGEIARAVLAGQQLAVPPSALLGSIAIERFFDFLALLAIVLAVLLPLGGIDREIRAASFVAAAICAVLLAGVVLFLFRTEACISVARRLLAPFPRKLAALAIHQLRHARVGLGAIAAPRLLARIFGWSLLQWVAILGCVVFSLRAVDVPVTLAGAVSVLLLNVIGLTLPAAPGHVGTVQLAFIAGLAPFGVSDEEAFAASVIYNALMVVPTIILGFPGLRRAGAELRARLVPG
ncbi:MAG: lysylphosphatidylglycerol synthase transmembrane domain-containing protein [Steroidobacteraceae bacterium]